MSAPSPILLDTDVFSALFMSKRETVIARGHPIAAWEASVLGRRCLISFQSRAEVLSGAHLANWGERRMSATRQLLDSTPTIEADDDVIDAYATLVAEARACGHPLGSTKEHTGDRWIAACAVAKGVPLLTGNSRHFTGAPRLVLH